MMHEWCQVWSWLPPYRCEDSKPVTKEQSYTMGKGDCQKYTQKKKNRSANSGQKQHHKYQMLNSMQHKFVQGLTTNLKWSSEYEWQTSDDNNSVLKMSYLQEPITLAP
jgi:hypothetical protein